MDQPTGHAAIAWSEIDTTNYPVGRKADIQIGRSPSMLSGRFGGPLGAGPKFSNSGRI